MDAARPPTASHAVAMTATAAGRAGKGVHTIPTRGAGLASMRPATVAVFREVRASACPAAGTPLTTNNVWVPLQGGNTTDTCGSIGPGDGEALRPHGAAQTAANGAEPHISAHRKCACVGAHVCARVRARTHARCT